MESSGFEDNIQYDLLGLSGVITYPKERKSKTKFRIRYGHYLSKTTAIEGGIGLSFYGEVNGYEVIDNNSPITAINLSVSNKIYTFYVAWMLNSKDQSAGAGIGPAISFYKLVSIPCQDKNIYYLEQQ